MNYPQIICIGEVLFDCLADQLGKELKDVISWTAYPGGAPANVACGLVKLGVSAAFLCCVGRDQAGDELIEILERSISRRMCCRFHLQTRLPTSITHIKLEILY